MRSTLLATTALLASASATANLHDRSYYEEKFFNWLREHEMAVGGGSQFVHMLQNFADNDDLIHTHNRLGNSSFQLGHNQFSHLNREEWRAFVQKSGLSKSKNEGAMKVHQAPVAGTASLPEAVDWVVNGAVTAVKDQGQCGSCWSFSTTGALEGAYFNKFNSLKTFSEQHLVDCDNLQNKEVRGFDHGCGGGWMDNAFDWVKRNGGIASEADYPYYSGTTTAPRSCDAALLNTLKDKEVAPIGFVDVELYSDAAMMSALAQQPVSVAIQADQAAFQLYKSGVFTEECGVALDHGVLAVGYGSENGVDYYKVKNSWSYSWGENGFIRLGRGPQYNLGQGQCGILAAPSYPVL